jgi:hypothetical protein
MKFLADECLGPELTKLAHARGYGESAHVVWLGRAGLKKNEAFHSQGRLDLRHEEFRGLPWPCRKAGCQRPVRRRRNPCGSDLPQCPPSMDLDMQGS